MYNRRMNVKWSVIIRLANTLRCSGSWFIIYNFYDFAAKENKSVFGDLCIWSFYFFAFILHTRWVYMCLFLRKLLCVVNQTTKTLFIHHNQTLFACFIGTEYLIIKGLIYPYQAINRIIYNITIFYMIIQLCWVITNRWNLLPK